ncbi:MAG: 5-amino-6-(D-ribitylamino)uracil--L-tyrosine 4-hydroxyphenyl transferase CofH [Chloroflexi bacterium]|nr:5-amino-6-(D-ribitylamino)uracil--L-tyrosine 4-hydroxyphenyl transferase CofH [Chloroflexota bacterium]
MSFVSPSEAVSSGLERLLRRVSPDVGRILDKALADRTITTDEAERLFAVQGTDLFALLAVADELRARAVGDFITYVVTRNINFTNVCYMGCRFCAFGRPARDPEAYTLSMEDVVQRAREAWEWGATEVCLQGGLNPHQPPTIYEDMVRAIKEAVPQIHIHAYSPFEIWWGSRRLGISEETFLRRLKDAGLGSIPGTAAEILVPEVRQKLTKNKLSREAWVRIVRTAHQVGIPSTATIMYGHIDAPRHWVEHIDLLRRLQRETGGFTEFVPLGFIHENTRLYLEDGARPGPTGMEDLKMHAIARLMLQHTIPNIQVSWVKLGYKMAQMCLQAGANDFGGTLFEESISRAAGETQGTFTAPETFERLIRDLGRIPQERDTLYRPVIRGRQDGTAAPQLWQPPLVRAMPGPRVVYR